MAPSLKTISTVLALTTLVAGKPISRRQDVPDDINTDTEWWCDRIDERKPEDIHSIWEDEIPGEGRSLGAWLSEQAEFFTDVDGGPNDGWAYNTWKAATGDGGISALQPCGMIGGDCAPSTDCYDWVERGFGKHYYAIEAVRHFHSKMGYANEYLQSQTLSDLMSLDEIAADFTTPQNWATVDEQLAAIGAIFYLAGGLANFGGASVGFAAAAIARPGVSRGLRKETQASIDKLEPSAKKDELQGRLDRILESSDAMKKEQEAEFTADGLKIAATTGSTTYLIGGVVNAIGIGAENPYGEVEASDLKPALEARFNDTRARLERMGRLALGRADPDEGDDYEMLPGQMGTGGDYPVENAIAMFFHDGNMLYHDEKEFRDTIETAYGAMRPRLVDAALTTGKFFLWNDEDITSEEDCIAAAEVELLGESGDKWPGWGYKWVYGYCVQLQREADSAQTCTGGSGLCEYFRATDENLDALENKYGFNLYDYYAAALECSILEGFDAEPDVWGLPSDGSTPRCWFGIEAWKGTKESCGSQGICTITFSDWSQEDIDWMNS